jgi:MATE family multidrug resistance protein
MSPELPARPFEVTHRSVLAIALPMTFAYLSTPLIGVVDTAVIGQLGDAALIGGIAVGAVIFDIVFTTFNFLRSGTTGLTAQAIGSGDAQEESAVLWRALSVGLVSGLIVIALQVPMLALALDLMGPSAPVATATRDYFHIRVLAAPFALANYAILGWLIGLGRAGTGLALQTLLNGLNIVLSVYFVLWLGWGIAGVAWGTVLSQTVTAIVGLGLVLAARGGSARLALGVIFDKVRFMRMLALNRDIMIRSFALLFAFAFFTAQGARSGDLILAANAVLMNFFLVASYFLDGMATAAEQLAGRAVGARWRPGFDRAVSLTLVWSFALALALSAILWLAGPLLIDLMTTSEDVRATARSYLVWAAATPLLGALAFQMDGVFIGATWSKDMRNMMLASLVAYLATWWLAVPAFGNHGLWLALLVFLSVRGVTLAWRCRARAEQEFA